ncbi:MAG: hypothetical protein AB7L84_04705 [Acidimicrobiia bacterium]
MDHDDASVDRLRGMGHPVVFLGAVVLVLNDHVLKGRFPGWWTGKLSDFAGLAVVGAILTAILGPRRGLAVASATTALAEPRVTGRDLRLYPRPHPSSRLTCSFDRLILEFLRIFLLMFEFLRPSSEEPMNSISR